MAGASLTVTIAAMVVFFTALNLLEATLPSLISKFAPPAIKGTASGVYSSVQFLGTFVGAAVFALSRAHRKTRIPQEAIIGIVYAVSAALAILATAVVALLVCLIPTTIGGLLSAIGIAGMDRMRRGWFA